TCEFRSIGVAITLAGWLVLHLAPLTAHAQNAVVPTNILRHDFWDTDGTINALLATNGRVYVGGSFSYVTPKARKLAAYDLHTGALDLEFPKIFGASIEV